MDRPRRLTGQLRTGDRRYFVSSSKRFACVRELSANRYWSMQIWLRWGFARTRNSRVNREILVVYMKNFFSISINTFWKIFTNIAHISHTRSANCFLVIYHTFSANRKKPCTHRSQTQYTHTRYHFGFLPNFIHCDVYEAGNITQKL